MFDFFNSPKDSEEIEQENQKVEPKDEASCPCLECNGSGKINLFIAEEEDPKEMDCDRCLGSGEITVEKPSSEVIELLNKQYEHVPFDKRDHVPACCINCNGTGRVVPRDMSNWIGTITCDECKGHGYLIEQEKIDQQQLQKEENENAREEDRRPVKLFPKQESEESFEYSNNNTEEQEIEDLSFFEDKEPELDYTDRDEQQL